MSNLPENEPENELSDTEARLRATEMLNMHIRDVVNDLLDALASPDGRRVRKAWDNVCLMFGRFGSVMKRSAFEQYLDELAAKDPP